MSKTSESLQTQIERRETLKRKTQTARLSTNYISRDLRLTAYSTRNIRTGVEYATENEARGD